MSLVHITRITPSKFGDGDRWRLEIDGEWYDAYLTADAGQLPAGDYDVEFKTSPKTGKVYAVAIDGRYRTQGGAQRPQQAPQAVPGSAPRAAPAPASAAPAESKAGAKDMWIMATSILQAVIAKDGCAHGNLVDLAREAANAARAAQRVFDGTPLDAARAAVRGPHPKPAPVDPDDPRETGPDFDDDIPF
jgi:hypothetical protein